MLSYHNNPAIKDKYLARVRAHRAADELIKGTGWELGKGCAVGCTLDAYDHARYPVELGIPEVLAHLEDGLFELMAREDAQLWPERFLAAIPVGVDLSRVWPQWAQWMLVDETHGVIRHAGGRQEVHDAIVRVADLYRDGGTPEQFCAVAAAASALATAVAAEEGAWAAARAAEVASAAAWEAAWAAEAAEAAAWAAEAEAAAWAPLATRSAYLAAASAAWVRGAADKLIALLESCR